MLKWVMAVRTTGRGCARTLGISHSSVSPLLAPAAAARVMHELAPLRGAGEAGTRQTDAGDASRFVRTRVPRRLRVALEWDRLPRSLPAPRLRTLYPQPGPPRASRDWPASPTNGAPPPPLAERGSPANGSAAGAALPPADPSPPAPPSRHRGPRRPSSRLVSGLRPPRPGA